LHGNNFMQCIFNYFIHKKKIILKLVSRHQFFLYFAVNYNQLVNEAPGQHF